MNFKFKNTDHIRDFLKNNDIPFEVIQDGFSLLIHTNDAENAFLVGYYFARYEERVTQREALRKATLDDIHFNYKTGMLTTAEYNDQLLTATIEK